MSNFFLTVNTRFASLPSAISWIISLQFWVLIAVLLAMQHLEGLHPQIVPQHLDSEENLIHEQ